MKTCNKCKQEKDYSEFHKRTYKSGTVGYQGYCKACQKSYDKNYYLEDKKRRLDVNKKWQVKFWEWYDTLKKEPCTDCQQEFDPVCMQWDHLPEYDKIERVSFIARTTMSKNKVLEEISKCELVCANCHALRTKQRKGS